MREIKPNHKNVYYGQLIELASLTGDKKNPRDFSQGYHAGVKIHYFNKKGVFLGNVYEFVPYEHIRFRNDNPVWPRHYMNKRFEKIRQFIFELKCRIITVMMRNTYKS